MVVKMYSSLKIFLKNFEFKFNYCFIIQCWTIWKLKNRVINFNESLNKGHKMALGSFEININISCTLEFINWYL